MMHRLGPFAKRALEKKLSNRLTVFYTCASWQAVRLAQSAPRASPSAPWQLVMNDLEAPVMEGSHHVHTSSLLIKTTLGGRAGGACLCLATSMHQGKSVGDFSRNMVIRFSCRLAEIWMSNEASEGQWLMRYLLRTVSKDNKHGFHSNLHNGKDFAVEQMAKLIVYPVAFFLSSPYTVRVFK